MRSFRELLLGQSTPNTYSCLWIRSSLPSAATLHSARSKLFALSRVLETCTPTPSTHVNFKDIMSSTGPSDSGSNPSMLHGHAAYVAAAAKVCLSLLPPTTLHYLSLHELFLSSTPPPNPSSPFHQNNKFIAFPSPSMSRPLILEMYLS